MAASVDDLLWQLGFHITSDTVVRRLKKRQSATLKSMLRKQKVTSTEENSIDERFSNLAEKFAIKGHDQRARALTTLKAAYLERLAGVQPTERILAYDMLALLLALSTTPLSTPYTLPAGFEDAPAASVSAASWREILQQDPLQGDHWARPENDSASDTSMDIDDLELPRDASSARHSRTTSGTTAQQEQTRAPFDCDAYYLSQLDAYSVDPPAISDASTRLKKRQYWHVQNSSLSTSPPQQSRSKSPKASENLLQDHQSLNTGLYDTGYVVGRKKKHITELDAVHEVLCMMRGYDCVLFKRHQGQQLSQAMYQFGDEYAVRHLSDAAFRRIMQAFASHGSMIYKLRRHTSRSVFVRRNGQTFQAFLVAVAHHLQLFDAYLASLEHKYRASTDNIISLLRLQDTLTRPLAHFRALYMTLMQCSRLVSTNASSTSARTMASFLLCTLFKQTVDANQTGSQAIANLMLDVFKLTLLPLARMLDRWIYHGSLADDYAHEFLVARNADILPSDERYWEDGHVLGGLDHGVDTCPLFAPSFVQKILYVGKAVVLCQALEQEPIFTPGKTLMNCIQDGFPSHALHFSTTEEDEKLGGIGGDDTMEDVSADLPESDNVLLALLASSHDIQPSTTSKMGAEDNNQDPISETRDASSLMECDLATCLDTYIQEHFDNATRHLLSLLLRPPAKKALPTIAEAAQQLQGGFMQQLHALGSVYLMLHSEIMHTFTTHVFCTMDTKGTHWYDTSFLNQAFVDACAALPTRTQSHLHRFTLRMDTNTFCRMSDPAESLVSQLSHLHVNYEVPAPMHYFIQTRDLTSYQNILHFLLRLKRAKYALENKVRLTRPRTAGNDPLTPLYTLRMRLIWYINALWRYAMITILDADTQRLQSQLMSVTSLDDMIAMHRQYLDNLIDKCLLNDKSLPIKKAVLRIMDLAERVAGLFETNHTLDISIESAVAPIADDFARTSDFIATSVAIMGNRGGLAWFQVLAVSLSQ
ncbi:Spc98 family-domain-containing protein [Gongronella butleri]|nr:Spc98 family-domain-containing protein [Gongronella butleri]